MESITASALRSFVTVSAVAVWFITVSCGGGGAEASGGTKGGKGKGGPGGAPAVPVVVAEARRQPVPLEIRAIGNVEAYSAIAVRPRVAAPLLKVHFSEGADVRAGQLLFTLDAREFQQAVREAEAAVAAQKAALGQAEANHQRDVAQAANARLQAERYASLAGKGIVSRQENEQFQTQAVAAERGAAASQATIESARAAVQGAEAKLADAKLQLSYTSIRAPIGGRTGALTYKAGDLVTANMDPPLITINQITPVYVTFSVPEQDLQSIRRYGGSGKLPVTATQQNSDTRFPGVLDFLDNRVDQNTGTIQVKGRFPNTSRQLWPGQFVNVAINLATPQETVVPSASVRNAQNGNYIFVVKPDMTTEQRAVEAARTYENLTVIAKGIAPGDKVVTEGQLRLRPNVKVEITSAAPPASAAVTPGPTGGR